MIKFKVVQFKFSFFVACLWMHVTLCSVNSVQEAAKQDIDFIYATILENHPGVYNDQDPTFVADIDRFYQVASASLGQIRRPVDHIKLIDTFLDSFHDTHMRFYPNREVGQHKKKSRQPACFKICRQEEIVWIQLPTFQTCDQQQKELEAIIDQMPVCRKASAIVFDLRGNSGGNSEWAEKIVSSLFTPEYFNFYIYQMNQDLIVDWRASRSNIDYVEFFIIVLSQQFGPGSKIVDEFKIVLNGMKKSYAQGKPLYAEKTIPQKFTSMHVVDPVTAKIVLIIDGSCVSACLDFIDMLKSMNHNVTLIGATTDADAVYMEVRVVEFPSGIGRLQFPIKMYRNRIRGHNQPYVPDIAFPKNLKKKKDVECWLQQTVQSLAKTI